jgi:hypothetical protein
MQVQNMAIVAAVATRAAQHQLCPKCGALMLESERLTEDGSTFVWYECSKGDCDGQWLTKYRTTLIQS